jgi:imidazolonepropionase-like amidohydrolase
MLRRSAAMIEALPTGPGRLLLRDARVLDLVAGVRSAPMDVLVEGPRILDLEPGAPRPGWAELPCEGMTLMPGLIDCHVHILSFFGTGQERFTPLCNLRQVRRNLRACLASGVVCVRDMTDPLGILRRVRNQVARGHIPGPRILSSGPMLTCPGGYPNYLEPVSRPLAAISGQLKIELRSLDEAVATVGRLAVQGVDLIKLGYAHTDARFDPAHPLPVLPDATIRAICREAHRRGLPVAMHHGGGRDLAGALRAPIDSLEHVMFDRPIREAEAQALAASGIVSVPTMTVQESLVRFGDKGSFLDSPRAEELFEPIVLARLRGLASRWSREPLDLDERLVGAFHNDRAGLRANYDSLGRMVQAGVPVCAGTDMGALVVLPGELPDELIRLEAAGLPRLDALRAATRHAARLLRLEDELGAVLPGFASDLVLLEGDPLRDLHAVRRPRLVGCGGRWYRPTHRELPDLWGETGVVCAG